MKYGDLNIQTTKFNLLLPICCFLLIFFAVSYWANISDKVWQQEQRQLLNEQTVTYAIEIEKKIDHILSSHQQIKHHIIAQDGTLKNISQLVTTIMMHQPEIMRVSFAPNHETLAVFPRADEPQLLGHIVRPPLSNTNGGQDTLRTFYSTPIKTDDQQMLFVVNKPLNINGQFWGYISYQLNIDKIINQLQLSKFSASNNNRYQYQLSYIGKHNKVTVLASSAKSLDHLVYSAPVKVPENNWLLEISFTNENFISQFNVGLIFRLLLTSAITLVIYWALLEPRRLRRQLLRTKASLSSNTQLLNCVLDNMNEGVLACDHNGEIYLYNQSAEHIYGIKPGQKLDINASYFRADDSLIGEATPSAEGLFHKALYHGEENQIETCIEVPTKLPVSLKMQSRLINVDHKKINGAVLFIQDITQIKQANNAHNSRNIILDMLAHEKPINSIFEHIINEIEANFDNIIGSVLLLDNNKTQFSDIIGPQLPDALIGTLGNLTVGDRVLSCGSAIHLNKMIIVEDVQTHPYWIEFKHLAWKTNVRSSWSHPIHSASGELLGCVDIYSNRINPASPTLILALREAATLTALTIERHRDSQRLRKISLAVQHSPNSLIIVDRSLKIEYVNPKFCAITGFKATELVGQPHNMLTASKDNRALYQEVWQCATKGKEWRGEIKSLKRNGDAYWAYDHVSPIKNDDGIVTKFVIVQEDITENRHQSVQFDYQQNHDMLTGLINIHCFNKNVRRAIESAKTDLNEYAICVIDLDNFKEINQRCSQAAGDELLRQIAAIFRNHLRQRDTLARLNADQFAILMKDCSLESARRCCNELLNLLSEHQFVWQAMSLSITGRAGVTCVDKNSNHYEQLMEQADLACYQAKSDGGNQTKIYQLADEQSVTLFGDAYWAKKIRTGLKHNHFTLYMQTTLSLHTPAAITGIEILVRLQDRNSLVLPQMFLPAALRYDLAPELDLWVIAHTLDWFANNEQVLHNIKVISINLSSASFGDDAQLIKIINIIEKYKELAQYLVFEITEYTALSSLSKAYHFIKSLNHYGVNFALDNFGNGNLSFAQMREIPISRLNIDGRLINSISTCEVSKVQVKSIAAMAQVMGIETTAKKVEDPKLIPILKQLLVDGIQGHSHSKAVPINNLLALAPQAKPTQQQPS